jgi:magnesium transporter
MRFFLISDRFVELDQAPASLPETGHLWISSGRREFEVQQAQAQAMLLRLTGSTLVDLHVSDLLNNQLPSHYDYTSTYDLLVFRRRPLLPAAPRCFWAMTGARHARPWMPCAPSTPARSGLRCSTGCC